MNNWERHLTTQSTRSVLLEVGRFAAATWSLHVEGIECLFSKRWFQDKCWASTSSLTSGFTWNLQKVKPKLKRKRLYCMEKNIYELERKRKLMYRVERKIKFCLSIPGRDTSRKRCCWQLVLHYAKSTLSWQPGRIQLDWDLWIEENGIG